MYFLLQTVDRNILEQIICYQRQLLTFNLDYFALFFQGLYLSATTASTPPTNNF